MNKGHLQIDYWVACAVENCHNYIDNLGNTPSLGKMNARKKGWIWIKEVGWVCPFHKPTQPICANCGQPLDYHEWKCVYDGQETGELFKVEVCEKCGYKKDLS